MACDDELWTSIYTVYSWMNVKLHENDSLKMFSIDLENIFNERSHAQAANKQNKGEDTLEINEEWHMECAKHR